MIKIAVIFTAAELFLNICIYLQSVKKYSGTTKKILKATTLNPPPSPPKSMLQKQRKRINKKLPIFWQQQPFIKGERGFVILCLTDCRLVLSGIPV